MADKKGFEVTVETILKCICWLSKQGLSLRGHRENFEDDEANSGNFCELVKFVSQFVPELREHLTSGPRNAQYLSPKVQNCVIDAVSSIIVSNLVDEVNRSGPFACIFDETTDRNKVEQISFVIKFVHEGQFKEVFIGFVDAYDAARQLGSSKLTDEILS